MLEAKFGPNGELSAVNISYPRDYVKEQLGYAAMYQYRISTARLQ